MKRRAALLSISALIGLGIASASQAGTFTFSSFTNDADSGVLPSNYYTHAIDFAAANNPVVGVTVNGVMFNGDNDNTTGVNSNWLFQNVGSGSINAGTNNVAAGGMKTVVNGFRYGSNAGGLATFTLKGLTPGALYQTDFYSRGWDAVDRTQTITTSDGTQYTYNQDQFGTGTGARLSYVFVATGNSEVFSVQAANPANTQHWYGLTNQYIIPPSQYGVFTLTGDGDSGVTSAKVYTHAVDVGAVGVNTPVNGVTFVGKSAGTGQDGGFGKTFSFTGATNVFTGDANNATGGMNTILSTFNHGATGGASKITLDGLTVGVPYIFTAYVAGFGNPGGRFITFGATEGSLIFDANQFGDNNAGRFTYNFTATATSESFTFDPQNSNDSFHVYAFTNELVPEPGTMGVLGMGMMAMALKRRKKA